MTKLQIAEREIEMVHGTASTSTELRVAIELYLPVDTERAREETETLESLLATRFYAAEEDLVTVRDQNERGAKRPQRTLSASAIRDLLGTRCEKSTDRILHLINALDRENIDPSMPPLTLIAVARAFVCKSVADAGYDQGIEDVRDILDSVIEDLSPMLQTVSNPAIS